MTELATTTKFKLNFINSDTCPIQVGFITELFNLQPTLARTYNSAATNTKKKNTNYWSAIILQDQSLDLSEAVSNLHLYLTSHMDKIDQVILDANFKCSITIVIKIFKKEAPYLKFPSELLRYCADHSIDINFDLIIY